MTPLVPWWLVLSSAVAAASLLLGSWRLERDRGRAPWRRAMLVVATACLWLLVLQLARERPVGAGSAILVTARADAAELAGLEAEAGRLALPGAPDGSGAAVADLALAVRRHPGVNSWRVVGVGLAPWQLELLPGEVSFELPAPPKPGIDRARWARRLPLGEAFAVRGSVALDRIGEATLRLRGPAGVEDEAPVSDGTAFTLRATPRQDGRLLYRLELAAGRSELAAERLDVEVVAPAPPRLLWLEGAPSFDSREVKAWLRELGGELTLRSQVSRGRFHYEFVNREQREFTRLSPALLADSDLLVIDRAAWENLSRSEAAQVEQALAEGLGLLLVPEVALPPGAAPAAATFATEAIGDLEALEVELEGPGLAALAPLVVTARLFVDRPGQRTLLRDAAGRALAVMRPAGRGRIGATLVARTHRWPLRGEAAGHRRYWSHLISALARPRSGAHIMLPPGPVWVDRPAAVTVQAGDDEPLRPRLRLLRPNGREMSLSPRQDPFESERWQATFWPRDSGWHRLSWGDDPSTGRDFFVVEPDEWAAWHQRQALQATAARAALGATTVGPRAPRADARPVALRALPRWPLFLLLISAWALLWADEQWRGA